MSISRNTLDLSRKKNVAQMILIQDLFQKKVGLLLFWTQEF